MRCMYCGCTESKVVDSRPTEDGWAIRRRREAFDVNKIRSGLMRACEKRPVSAEDIDSVVAEVQRRVFNSLDGEITSQAIGEIVMDKLRELDQVAYVRFASVYRQFRDLRSFREELNRLLEE